MPAGSPTVSGVPSCPGATSPRPAIRERCSALRYCGLVLRQAVQMKNRVAGLGWKTGVTYNKLRLHGKGYFREMLSRS